MARPVIGAVVLLLALAGCGGGDPKVDPTPSPSSPVTTPVSTTPSAPAMPEAAKANTKAGAIAFVRYYVEVFNLAQQTGSSAELATLSSPKCDECATVVSGLRDIYGAHGHIEGGALDVGAVTADHNTAEDVWLLLLEVESGPQSVFASADAEPKQLPGGRRSMDFSLKYAGDGWKVEAWTRT